MKAKKLQILVVGGGISGSYVSLLLASAGFEVTLCEKKPFLFHGASGRNWGRLHFGQMAPDRLGMSSRIMQTSLVALPVLEKFLIVPPIRPEYYVPTADTLFLGKGSRKLSPEVYRAHSEMLALAFHEAVAHDRKINGLSMMEMPYCKELEQDYIRSVLARTDCVGFSSNEAAISLQKLCLSLSDAMLRHGVNVCLNTEIIQITSESRGFRVEGLNRASDESFSFEVETVINAAYDGGIILDPASFSASSSNSRYSFRLQRYGIVDAIASEGEGTYRSVLALDGAHYFQLGERKAVIESKPWSDASFSHHMLPEAWKTLIDYRQEAKDVSVMLDACRSQFAGIFDNSEITEFFYATSWTIGEDSGFVPSALYRNVSSGQYYAHASSKIPICFVSAFHTLLQILKDSECSVLRDMALDAMSCKSSVAARNAVLDWFGDVLPMSLGDPSSDNRILSDNLYSKTVEIVARMH
jgi:hypothetical protein